MEDNKKNSFYDILLANSEVNRQETTPIAKKYIALSWLVVFFANITILYFGWNYAVSLIFKFPLINYYQSILLYAVSKILTRGFFSVQ